MTFCTDPDDMRYKTLADRARYFKKTEEGVRSMCRLLEEMREETAKNENIKTATEMIRYGKFTDSEISRFSFLSEEEVHRLRGEIANSLMR